MATLEEIYRNALADEGERLALARAASDPRALAEFLGRRGCGASPEEARAFMDGRLARTGELSNEELAAASGGGCGDDAVRCGTCGSTDTFRVMDEDRMGCRSCGARWSVSLPSRGRF